MGRFREWFAARRQKSGSADATAEWSRLAEFLGVDGEDRDALSEATYYACVKTLSESVGKLSCKLQQRNDRNGVATRRDHPLYGVLAERPNRFMTAAGFWATFEQNRCCYGNAFAYISGYGPETQLWILPSYEVTVWYDDACRIDRVPDVYYQWDSPSGPVLLSSEEVLHVRTADTFDGIKGIPVIERLATTVGGNRDAQGVLNALYDSNLSQKMVLNYTANLSDKSAEAMARLVQDYAQGKLRDRGIENVIPIPLGATLTPLNMKMADSQFLELRKYSAIQIASAFGIKPYQIGDYGKESYSSQTAQQLAFYKDTLLWILTEYEQELTYKLLTQRERNKGLYFKFNISSILRADQETQIQMLSTAVSSFLYTPNEARALLDLEAKEGGDELLGNGSAIPVRMVGRQYVDDPSELAEGGEEE